MNRSKKKEEQEGCRCCTNWMGGAQIIHIPVLVRRNVRHLVQTCSGVCFSKRHFCWCDKGIFCVLGCVWIPVLQVKRCLIFLSCLYLRLYYCAFVCVCTPVYTDSKKRKSPTCHFLIIIDPHVWSEFGLAVYKGLLWAILDQLMESFTSWFCIVKTSVYHLEDNSLLNATNVYKNIV